MTIGCALTSFEWIRAGRHIYGMIRHMQGLYRFCRIRIMRESFGRVSSTKEHQYHCQLEIAQTIVGHTSLHLASLLEIQTPLKFQDFYMKYSLPL